MRSTASKVMWVGRATVVPVVVAMILVVAFGASPASAHKGYKGLLHLGHNNAIAKVTTLVGKVATGSAFVVKNPSGGSALGLQVNAGQAPLTVNAEAGTATNLDADKLDGKSKEDFYAAGSKVEDSANLDGKNSAEFIQRNPTEAQSGSIHIDGQVRTSGMLRTGSETGTFEGPGYGLRSYEGLVVRRAVSSSVSAGLVIARTAGLRLERDGTMGGLRVAWNATRGGTIACMGLTQAGAPVGNFSRVGGSTPGTFQVFTDSQNVVYYSCSFGQENEIGDVTEVTMARDPGFKSWVGTLTSSVNQ